MCMLCTGMLKVDKDTSLTACSLLPTMSLHIAAEFIYYISKKKKDKQIIIIYSTSETILVSLRCSWLAQDTVQSLAREGIVTLVNGSNPCPLAPIFYFMVH